MLRRVFHLFGYDLVSRRKNFVKLEYLLPRIFDKYRINCVLDVGANCGQYGQFLRRSGFRGRIISFEPVEKSFEALQALARKDPAWEAYNFALGDEEKKLTINVFQNSDLASFCAPSDYMGKMFTKGGALPQAPQDVPVHRLDAVWTDILKNVHEPRVMLKMDTQGYDLHVFKGAGSRLAEIQVLQSELSYVPLYKGMPDFMTMLETYKKEGFEISGIFSGSRETTTLRVIEFDCVLVRN